MPAITRQLREGGAAGTGCGVAGGFDFARGAPHLMQLAAVGEFAVPQLLQMFGVAGVV